MNYINVYVYTYRKKLVVSPAAANGKREGPMSGGDSAGSYTPVLMPTHAPVISAFAKLSQNVL